MAWVGGRVGDVRNTQRILLVKILGKHSGMWENNIERDFKR
jgi:hypothetical protein